MTLEDQIAALCAEAEPLRCLPDEEAEARGLPQLVERINLLRSMQMTQRAGLAELRAGLDAVIAETDEEEFQAVVAEVSPPKRRGRPPKVAA